MLLNTNQEAVVPIKVVGRRILNSSTKVKSVFIDFITNHAISA